MFVNILSYLFIVALYIVYDTLTVDYGCRQGRARATRSDGTRCNSGDERERWVLLTVRIKAPTTPYGQCCTYFLQCCASSSNSNSFH